MARMSEALQASLIPHHRRVPDLSPWSYRLRKRLLGRLPVPVMTALARTKERATGAQTRPPPPPGQA